MRRGMEIGKPKTGSGALISLAGAEAQVGGGNED